MLRQAPRLFYEIAIQEGSHLCAGAGVVWAECGSARTAGDSGLGRHHNYTPVLI